MRMRKLGKGQALTSCITSCIPEEIKTKRTLVLLGKSEQPDIDVSDVLRWVVSETWIDMRCSMLLWAVQGERFEKQHAILTK